MTVKMTVPAGAKGALYLIACVSKVKGEPGGGNNCLAPTRPTAVKPAGAGAGTPAAPAASATPADPLKTPTPPADPPGPPDPPPDPTFPERFLGTASAQHTDSRTVTPTGPDPGDTLGSTTSWKSTLTADVVFTRTAAQGGGYQYVSDGRQAEMAHRAQRPGRDPRPAGRAGHPPELHRRRQRRDRDRPIRRDPVRERDAGPPGHRLDGPRRAVQPRRRLGLRGPWYWFDEQGLLHRGLHEHRSERGAAAVLEGNELRAHALVAQRELHLRSDPGQSSRKWTAQLDGSLVGQESCQNDVTRTLNSGAVQTDHYTSSWTWNLVPAGP